jgi:mRNA interferase MazF
MQKIYIGDIVFIPFPFSDLSETKKRPALVISKNNDQDIVLAKISSVIKNNEFNYLLNPKKLNFVLHKQSQVSLNVISTIQKNLIVKKIGRLYDDEIDVILTKIKQNLTR